MQNVKIGIVGIGNMGSVHAKNIFDGQINHLELGAVCDIIIFLYLTYITIHCLEI